MSDVARLPMASAPARRAMVRPKPQWFRRALLIATVMTLPLQDHLPPIAGFSVVYLAFLALTLVAVIAQPRALMRAGMHRIFVAAYVLAAVGLVMEMLHTNPQHVWWSRMVQMILGGVVFASYCRSERNIQTILSAQVLTSLVVAFIVVNGTYGAVAAVDDSGAGFSRASMVRAEAMKGLGLHANPNAIAFFCAAAGAVAVGRAILARGWRRYMYVGVFMYLTMATFMTFSRSGVATLVMATLLVFFALLDRRHFLRLALPAAAIVLVVAIAVPKIVFERFSFNTSYSASGRREARAEIYLTLLSTFPSYAATGVGEGNYWGSWAVLQGLATNGQPSGAHNCYLQIAVYWGVVALSAALGLIWMAWRTLRTSARSDPRWVPLKAFSLAVTMESIASHDISDKQFSIVLGMIVGLALLRETQARAARHSLRTAGAQP